MISRNSHYVDILFHPARIEVYLGANFRLDSMALLRMLFVLVCVIYIVIFLRVCWDVARGACYVGDVQ